MRERMNVPTRTEVITITKIEKGRVFDGQVSWPQNRFDNSHVGDKFKVVMQACNILSVTKENK